MRLSRQNKILEIIRTNDVETQEQLLSLLRDAGYSVTQATVSRDIRELQLVKGQGKDGKYSLAHFVQRWVQYNVETEASESNDLDLEKAMHEAVKRRKTEIQVEMLEGQLVEVAAVSKLWSSQYSKVWC